jgi:4,5-dihydroxyphthalate decarboxylase
MEATAVRTVKTAIGSYGLTMPIKDGRVSTGRLNLDHVIKPEDVSPDFVLDAMRAMARRLEFDISEMAITTYLCARAAGTPVTAIPVFVTRSFPFNTAIVNEGSGIEKPKDIEGRTVGVSRGYTVTTGLWIRGLLQTECGVDLSKVTWAATGEDHVPDYNPPANVHYDYEDRELQDLMKEHVIEAAVGVRNPFPGTKLLLPDANSAAPDYYERTGIYPINHTIVIQDALLAEAPWIATELFNTFKASKAVYLGDIESGKSVARNDADVVERAKIVGDPFPFGIGPNRKALETVLQFAAEQQVIPRKPSIDELFARNTLDLE